jgi:lysophospholipase L1-like esterase
MIDPVASSAPGFHRYVAIGDSTTEGLGDPSRSGGYRGWADRLAERLAETNPTVQYANLAVRGLLAGQVHAQQLEPAVKLHPDLASAVAGMNDALRPSFDAKRVAGHIEAMLVALTQAGATVLTFTLPDPVPVMPIARFARPRLIALNQAVREAAARAGAVLVDMERHPVTSDPRLWSHDRLHPNAAGHERIAAAAAEALGLPGADGSWAHPLPSAVPLRMHQRTVAELNWAARYLTPALVRRTFGRSSGDGLAAKRDGLLPVNITSQDHEAEDGRL